MMYILLNGPIASGRSEIAKELCASLTKLGPCAVDSFASPLRHFVSTALGDKYKETDKEKARPELSGYSVNQWVRSLTNYMYVTYGEDVLARLLIHRSLRWPNRTVRFYIVDDAERPHDIVCMPNRFVVKVQRPFRDTGFVYHSMPHYTLNNNGNLSDLWVKAEKLSHAISKVAL